MQRKAKGAGKEPEREGFAPASASCAPGPVSRGHGGGSGEKVREISPTGRVLLLLRRLDRAPLWCQRRCWLCLDFAVAVGRSRGLNNRNREASNFYTRTWSWMKSFQVLASSRFRLKELPLLIYRDLELLWVLDVVDSIGPVIRH